MTKQYKIEKIIDMKLDSVQRIGTINECMLQLNEIYNLSKRGGFEVKIKTDMYLELNCIANDKKHIYIISENG